MRHRLFRSNGPPTMKIIPAIFEEREIRRLYDEKTETWFFSVVDIIQVLTQQPDFQVARKYWNKLKERLVKEGSQLVTNCHRLKLPAEGRALITMIALSPWLSTILPALAQQACLIGLSDYLN